MERQQGFGILDVSGATIRSTSKRRTAMKILIYLKRENERECMPLSTGEVSEGLDIAWETTSYNLNKLMECSFIEKVEDKMDARTCYFQVVNKEATEKAIELYKRRVGFKLGRLIPYDKIHSEKLKSDKRFIERCKFYGLTFYQGLCAVEKCPKIGIKYIPGHQGEFYLWRNDIEGYEERKPSIDEKQTEPEDI